MHETCVDMNDGDVGVRLGRVVEAAAVVLVEAVAPLVEEDAGDLAGVVAAAAGLEEVDASSPFQTALQVWLMLTLSVSCCVSHDAAREPGAGVLGDPVQMVEAACARRACCRRAEPAGTAQSVPALAPRSRSASHVTDCEIAPQVSITLTYGPASVVVAVDPPGVQLNSPDELVRLRVRRRS